VNEAPEVWYRDIRQARKGLKETPKTLKSIMPYVASNIVPILDLFQTASWKVVQI
jgi:hypothetical protein